MRPFFKWPGGKFKLLSRLVPLLPVGGRLVEPFVGSGAVFLNTVHSEVVIADANRDLMFLYRSLADRGEAFIEACRVLFTPGANSKEEYYCRRDAFNRLSEGDDRRSALFLYLNRHGYNGLIRYNAKGAWNVPFGAYARPYFPERELRHALERLSSGGVRCVAADFRETFGLVCAGDVVYCDPPYIPLSSTANFTAYAGMPFGWEEQEELAGCAERAARVGATVVISNHDTPHARRLYRNASVVHSFQVRRSISCRARKPVTELLAVYAHAEG